MPPSPFFLSLPKTTFMPPFLHLQSASAAPVIFPSSFPHSTLAATGPWSPLLQCGPLEHRITPALPSLLYNSSFSLKPQYQLAKEREKRGLREGERGRESLSLYDIKAERLQQILEQTRQICFKYFCRNQKKIQGSSQCCRSITRHLSYEETGCRDIILDLTDISHFPQCVSYQDSLFYLDKFLCPSVGDLRYH